MSARRQSPAAARNREPILEVLRGVLPVAGTILEVASGTGEHGVHFARALPHLTWQPSDIDPDALASIEAWRREENLANLRAPVELDVVAQRWPATEVDAIFNANMIHISPWTCCLGLLAGAQRYLRPGAPLILYGPFVVNGRHTAPSNAAFDASLRARDPTWGVRDLQDVITQAEACGLGFVRKVAMPANNLCVVFVREGDGS